jgi:hypothetical protein
VALAADADLLPGGDTGLIAVARSLRSIADSLVPPT